MSYDLRPDFERIVVGLCARKPRFYGRIGCHLDPEMLELPEAKLVLEAVRAIAEDSGRGPDDDRLVLERLNRWRREGRVTHDGIDDVLDLFEEVDESGPHDLELMISELAPVVRRTKEKDAVAEAIETFGKRGDLGDVGEKILRLQRLGKNEGTLGIKFGPGVAKDIEALRHLSRLATGIPELDSIIGGGFPRGRQALFIGGPGEGKCSKRGQGVLLSDGSIRKVEDIDVGDHLMGPDSLPRRVLSTNSGSGLMYEIRPVKGKPWQVNFDHVLTLAPSGTRYGDELVDVSVRDWFGWSARKKHHHKLVRVGVEAFDGEASAKDLPVDPYILGVLLGDGSTRSSSTTIANPEPEIREALTVECASRGLRLHVVGGTREGCPTYGLYGTRGERNPLTTDLRALGLWGLGSGDKFVPPAYLTAVRACRLEILAGLIDTDGSLEHAGFDYVSKSERLANDVAFLARSLGLAAQVTPCEKWCQNGGGGTYYRLFISGHTDMVPCRVARKKAPPRRQKKNVLVTGFDVVAVGEYADYFGFTLSGDSRYLLDDFTVTHNSMFLSHMTAQCSLVGGFNCYATLELHEAEVSARIIGHITGEPVTEIMEMTSDAGFVKLEHWMPHLGPVYIKFFTPQATTVSDITEWVKECEEREGQVIDHLAVDYMDKLTSNGNKPMHQVMLEVGEGLRLFARDKDIWHTTASQRKTRSGKDRKRLTDVDDAADAQNKTRVADLVITLNTDPDDTDMMTYNVAKNRSGPRGVVGPLPVMFELGRMAPILAPRLPR